MKAFIKYLGIIDNEDNIHHLEFFEGVNVITGKSSTGKSAILEVFDYCFGSSEFNIPDGVITNNAKLYFSIISLSKTYLILGRGVNKNVHYLSFETNPTFVNDYKNFNTEYFDKLDKINSADFNKELNKYFGINIEDTDEDLEDKKYRKHNAKKAAPSYRNFTSFILQHQNLIANKHALFYRFDEKEKKDQTIEQLKIFLSLVDAKYFPLKQRLAELSREKKIKELLIERTQLINDSLKNSLESLLEEYEIKTNTKLFKESIDDVISKPKKYLNFLENFEIKSIDTTDINTSKRNEYQKKYNSILAEIRKNQNTISNIETSILYAKDFKSQISNISSAKHHSPEDNNCFICGQENLKINNEKNKLVDAIKWFNAEMGKSTYTIESFESDKKLYEIKIKNLREDAKVIKNDISFFDKIIEELNKNRSIEEQAFKVLLKIETFLETIEENNIEDIDNELEDIINQIMTIEKTIADDYNVEYELSLAQRQINQQMNRFGKNLDFEKIYKDNLNLKFDIHTFELYQQNKEKGQNTKKVYLRSMGSGANWLYSHVSLFTSLLYYFCDEGNQCLIPSILILDQPSQVYFPSEIDKESTFNPKKLKESSLKEGENLELKWSEDLASVTNLYNQLVEFCEYTLKETGIKPQIIITDHADNLKLEKVEFESLIRGRWRKNGEGFIQNTNLQK